MESVEALIPYVCAHVLLSSASYSFLRACDDFRVQEDRYGQLLQCMFQQYSPELVAK
jgi:hypothetical protein